MARKLRMLGFDASALLGGYNAWKRAYDVEPKSAATSTPTSAGTAT